MLAGSVPTPSSAPMLKKHEPIKCGYICIDCKGCHISEEKLCSTYCAVNIRGRHKVIKRSTQCQNCYDLSDDSAEFARKNCPGDRPKDPPRAPRPSPSEAPTSPASVPPENPSPLEADLFMELRMAEMEMARLVMLESLERERREMDLLLQKKRKATGDPSP